MAEQIKIEGLDKLLKKLGAIKAKAVLKSAITAGALRLKDKVARYPPSTSANLPPSGGGSFYQRGYGTRYVSKLTGRMSGKKTSERLGASWAVRISPLAAEVGNKAKYAPWVQSNRRVAGRGPQASFHASRGWNTLQDEARKVVPSIEKDMQDEINKQLR